jgi:AraC-like DNA-binding protein
MAKRELPVPARYYMRLQEVLGRQGIDMRDLLSELSLPLAALEEPDATLYFSQVEQIIARAVEASGRSDLGFELGRLLTVSTHSVVGFGMVNSPTVEHAMHFVARYFRLVMPSFRMRYTSGPDHGELLFTPTAAMGHQCLSFHIETIAMAALRDVHDMVGSRPPCRMYLSIAEPPHVQRYNELHDVQCIFGTDRGPSVRLLFQADFRRFPISMADTNALKVAEERCRALVQQVAGVRQFADWVAMTLREVGDGVPSLAELAGALNLSTRTLNRYLEREGTSYRELAGRIQHELACERLAAGVLSITEIAYSLGFRDTANFTRAFRSRAGCSPRDYRLRLAAKAESLPGG